MTLLTINCCNCYVVESRAHKVHAPGHACPLQLISCGLSRPSSGVMYLIPCWLFMAFLEPVNLHHQTCSGQTSTSLLQHLRQSKTDLFRRGHSITLQHLLAQ